MPTFSPTDVNTDLTGESPVDDIAVYLATHYLNKPSQLYAYLLWAGLLLVLLITKLPLSVRRTRTFSNSMPWRILRYRLIHWPYQKKLQSRPPGFLPTNTNIVLLSLFFAFLCCLSTVGPDYIGGASFKLVVDLSSRGTIFKSIWTSAARAGTIAFSLLPLCVLLALKSSPPAIFSWKITTQLYFDKLAVFHKWIARFLYLFTANHVILWTIKLCTDRASDGSLVVRQAFQNDRFVCGCVSFGIFTILMATSVSALRRSHYEAFYALHLLLFPIMLVMCAFHHPETGWWAWVSLSLWLAERIWRCGRMFALNYTTREYDTEDNFNPAGPVRLTSISMGDIASKDALMVDNQKTSVPYQPPAGYAHAELLCGATVRLTYTSSRKVQWAPGQYFLLNIPSISKLTSHPFTCCSISQETTMIRGQHRMVFLIRAKNGWTKDLWEAVASHTRQGRIYVSQEAPPPDLSLPRSGLVMKTYIDGPFGSSIGIPWECYSGALIIVGGSGVTFGLSVLEHLSGILASHPKGDGYMKLQRIRFVWLVRDFGHIQWCASIIRRCKLLLSEDRLQVDIFVTKSERMTAVDGPVTELSSEPLNLEKPLPPPTALSLNRPALPRLDRGKSLQSLVSNESNGFTDEDVTTDGGLEQGQGDDPTKSPFRSHDLTEFEGELDVILPGEIQLAHRIKREGRVRRVRNRKARISTAVSAQLERPHSPSSNSYPSSPIFEEGTAESESGAASNERAFSAESHRPLAQRLRGPNRLFFTIPEDAEITPRESLDDSSLSGSTTERTRHYRHGSGVSRSQESWLPLHCAPPQPPQALSYRNPGLDTADKEEVVEEAEPIQIRLDDRELKDIVNVAENAKPGRPRLARILQFELEEADESLLVTCCGPVSLNVLVRETIAARMSIEAGKRNGKSIVYHSEEFEY